MQIKRRRHLSRCKRDPYSKSHIMCTFRNAIKYGVAEFSEEFQSYNHGGKQKNGGSSTRGSHRETHIRQAGEGKSTLNIS